MREGLFSGRSNRPGFLVTIDGPNGSGKTFLTRAIEAELRAAGIDVHSTAQPSPSPLGEMVRGAEREVRGKGLACLVAADRHQQVEGEIAAHLGAGEVVLCDRYIESSLVLQRIDEVETEFILGVNVGISRPDLRIRLLADPEAIEARLAARAPNPGRRLEQSAGAQRELELYEAADRLLSEDYDLPAKIYDTTGTDAQELGARAALLVRETRETNGR